MDNNTKQQIEDIVSNEFNEMDFSAIKSEQDVTDNINNLLTSRYLGHLSRKQHKHVKGPKKRNYRTSQFFLRELEKIFIENKINEEKAILE